MANLKSINSLSDINLDKMKSKDVLWILETLHRMKDTHSNDSILGREVRHFLTK